MQKLTFDAEAQTWSFDNTPQEGMNAFDRGKLAFHRGDFSGVASLIEDDLRSRGESESKLFWLAMSYMRLGEARNCLPGVKQVCTIPFTTFHQKPEYALHAARLFERLLDKYDRRSYLYRWRGQST